MTMRSRTILIFSLFWPVTAFVQSQDHPSLYGTVAEQGRPVSGGMVILARLRNAKCARIFESKNPSVDEQEEFESCEQELPRTQIDSKGNYSYSNLPPGLYDIRFWWLMSAPPPGDYFVLCSNSQWGVGFAPGKELTRKYTGFAQSMSFKLKENESKRIDFDYRGQITDGANCTTLGGPGFTNPGAPKPDEAQISIPGTKGILALAPGPSIWQGQFMPADQQTRLQALDRPDHLLVTAFLQKVPFEAGAERCRDARWPESERQLRERQGKLDSLQQSSKGGMALVEFTVGETRRAKAGMKDIHAYWGSGHLCAEVHLSKAEFEPEDQRLFDEVLATVRFLPDI